MKSILCMSLVVLSVGVATPVFAQGIYVGPGGVGVDGGRSYDRGYDRDSYRDRDEGRSVYRDFQRHDRQDYDDRDR